MENIKNLDKKIETDIENCTKRVQQMTEELREYNDLPNLRLRYEQLKNDLCDQRTELTRLRDNLKQQIHMLTRKHENIQKQLNKNDINTALNELQLKIRICKQNNFSLQECKFNLKEFNYLV